MDKELIEKYKQEMLDMYRSRYGAIAVQSAGSYDNKGRLIVNVTAIRGLYPVPNAVVTVFVGAYEDMTVIDTSRTDESGKSKTFFLDAPDISLSQNSGAEEPVYTNYSVKVTADGYVDEYNLNLPIFRGVTSLQNVDLTLISTSNENGTVINDQEEEYDL